MLQDPNIERYVVNAIKPLQKQIKELKAEIEAQQQVKNLNIPVVSTMYCCCMRPQLNTGGDYCMSCNKFVRR